MGVMEMMEETSEDGGEMAREKVGGCTHVWRG